MAGRELRAGDQRCATGAPVVPERTRAPGGLRAVLVDPGAFTSYLILNGAAGFLVRLRLSVLRSHGRKCGPIDCCNGARHGVVNALDILRTRIRQQVESRVATHP